MAQYQITVNDEILHGLFQGDEGLGKLLTLVLNQILQSQVTEQIQAERNQLNNRHLGGMDNK